MTSGTPAVFVLSNFHWGSGLTFTATASLVLTLAGFLAYKHHQQRKREAYSNLVKKHEEIITINSNGKVAKLISGKEIKRATDNFSQANLLGSGGFGEVFKGVLDDGTLTAIKRAKLGNTKGIDQVLNEVRVLCQVNHRSLVQLLGCCLELEQPVLVYEYVPNGTLFDHLHGCYSNKWGTLSWHRRLIIAHQTADGLAYLHFSSVPPILHRDIKSSNILLDEKLDGKVSDFGLSRLVDTDATHISTCAQGTLGYLDPEYFSFGVVLLELLTSKKAVDFNREDEDVNLAVYVRKMADEEQLMDIIDPALKNRASDLELETMKALGLLALACLDEKRQDRPSMREVAEDSEYILHILTRESSKA
ncbi:Wall-associated receptor kinase-like 20 [Ancistrocladus abbreviatus]